MKKDKEWLLKEISKLDKTVFLHRYGVDAKVKKGDLLQLVDQLDEPKKVTVPKWFDEWVKYKKETESEYDCLALAHYIVEDYNNGELTNEQMYYVVSKPRDILSALLYGYEVKEEKLYWVLDKEGLTMITKEYPDKRIAFKSGWYRPKDIQFYLKEYYLFTEKEIRDYDERYLPFAVPVEEVGS